MELIRHEDIDKDLKNLRRFSAPLKSLEAWERLFCLKGIKETPAIEAYPGFGREKIFKGRVIPLQENIGKRKGYRIVIQMMNDSCYMILVFSRHDIYKTEYELMQLIKTRLSN